MISNAERIADEALRTALAGAEVAASIDGAPRFEKLLSALDWFVPEILHQRYEHWRWEGLDGIRVGSATKTGERQAEVLGLCCLIQDQTWTPIHVQLRHVGVGQGIEWMACRVGAPGTGHRGLLRLPDDKVGRLAPSRVAEDPEAIDWVYTATFGEE